MSDLDFTICCIVTFFSKKRRTPPNLNNGKYCPHLVIKGTEEYLGVNFIDGEDVTFDKPIRANALPVNEDIDYSALQVGTEFFIIRFFRGFELLVHKIHFTFACGTGFICIK